MDDYIIKKRISNIKENTIMTNTSVMLDKEDYKFLIANIDVLFYRDNFKKAEILRLKEKIKEYYQNCIIEVEFIDFRKYKIMVKIETKNEIFVKTIEYLYDSKLTFKANIDTIIDIINKKIIIPFYMKGE